MTEPLLTRRQYVLLEDRYLRIIERAEPAAAATVLKFMKTKLVNAYSFQLKTDIRNRRQRQWKPSIKELLDACVGLVVIFSRKEDTLEMEYQINTRLRRDYVNIMLYPDREEFIRMIYLHVGVGEFHVSYDNETPESHLRHFKRISITCAFWASIEDVLIRFFSTNADWSCVIALEIYNATTTVEVDGRPVVLKT